MRLSGRERAASHRMLIYHFGSKEGLLVAVIRSVEAAQREFFAQLVRAQPELPPGDGIRLMWRHFTDPQFAPHERLFFEIYAQALRSQPGTIGLLDDVVDAWIEPVAAYAVERGVPAEAARADARLGVAVIRGLLLDLLASGNRSAVDAALERYIAQYKPFSPARNSPAELDLRHSRRRSSGAGHAPAHQPFPRGVAASGHQGLRWLIVDQGLRPGRAGER